jgi:hypothetical protein
MTVTAAETSVGVMEIGSYMIRRCRLDGDVPPRQVLKKRVREAALVVNNDWVISLLCEKRSELIDQSAAMVWHENLLAESR